MLPSIRKLASKIGRLPGTKKPVRGMEEKSQRRLHVDPLEERQLLSISAGMLDQQMINETVTQNGQLMEGTQAIAVDNDGDFVATWMRYDTVLDQFGNPVMDPITHEPMLDANIYARYFTDEVQRLTLPDEVTTDDVPGYATFSIKYGGNEVQRLQLTQANEPYTSFDQSIVGTITLGFDGNGDNVISAAETQTFSYNEDLTLEENRTNLEAAVRQLGPKASDAEVQAVSSREFLIKFGNSSNGENLPQITIENTTTFTSGFYPNAWVETVRQPVVVQGIPIIPGNPEYTAGNIEYAFYLASTTEESYGPIKFAPSDRIPVDPDEPRFEPEIDYWTALEVSVNPLSDTQFDVTFVGNAGKQDHPELEFTAIRDERGNILPVASGDIETLKEPSSEFRVNDEEIDNPATMWPDTLDQRHPVVAMDADGEFIIAWDSDVSNLTSAGSVRDVFARRFEAIGIDGNTWTDANGNAVTGVRPVEMPSGSDGEFRVNSEVSGPQWYPSVGMDASGNFVVAWQSHAQDFSYFNTVRAQWFDRDGNMLGVERLISQDTTDHDINPYVTMSADGHTAITWSTVTDSGFLNAYDDFGNLFGNPGNTSYAIVFAPDRSTLVNQFTFLDGGNTSAAFDSANNLALSVTTGFDTDLAGAETSAGVYSVMLDLYNDDGTFSGAVLRSPFRGNSASLTTGTGTQWPFTQTNGQALLDADGDIIFTYSGFGPDASEFVMMDGSWFEDQINATTNSDLLPYFDPSNPFSGSLPPLFNFYNNGDVDGVIDEILWKAQVAGATNEQVGRLSRILNEGSNALRGEASGALFSMFDADTNNQLHLLYSDNVANSDRDGRNDRWFIALDALAESGDFVLRLRNLGPGWVDGSQMATLDVEIPVVYLGTDPDRIDVAATRDSIEAALQAAALTGDYWPLDIYLGSVEVRTVCTPNNDAERTERAGTDWALEPAFFMDFLGLDTRIVYEVTFLGEVHDTNFDVSLAPNGNGMERDGVPAFPPYFAASVVADVGEEQLHTTGGIEPDGDFVIAWQQYEESNGFTYSNDNFYFRTFDESSDTAGPTVSDVAFANGDWIQNGAQVTNTGALEYTPVDGARVVLTFDEEMRVFSEDQLAWANGIRDQYAINPSSVSQANQAKAKSILDSVTNPENYELLRNGVTFDGGVSKVEYGLNMAYDLGLSSVRSNKWEAVLTLDGDMTELTGDLQVLPAGTYVVRALNPDPSGNLLTFQSGLRDVAGQPLYHTGYLEQAGIPYGLTYASNSFVIPTDEGSVTPSGTFPLPDPDEAFPDAGSAATWAMDNYPNSPQYVAQDADGDTVVVWTEDSTGLAGIHAQLYDAQWTNDNGSRESTLTPVREILVTDSPTATYGSVARDGDGDFVVTWSQKDASGWNVYARRYDALGNAMSGAFRVNQETAGDQCFPNIAMDVEGKFVITWQSSDQDGSGWGVFAQQFTRDGERVGIVDELQLLSFNGVSEADYTLAFGGTSIGPIAYDASDLTQSAQNIVDAFAAAGVTVEAEAVSAKDISVHFTGTDAALDQPPLLIGSVTGLVGDPWGEITTQTLDDGQSGEISVNLQIQNDQQFPSVAMNSTGDFVISWTATGLGSDDPDETDVRARLFQWTTDDSGNDGYASGTEFVVNVTTNGSQKWSSVGMDASGDFVISWTNSPQSLQDVGYLDGAGGQQDIYARRYTWDGDSTVSTPYNFQIMIDPGDPAANPPVPPTYATYSQFLVNTFTTNTQQHSQVAMDADGDFVIAWESFQDRLGASVNASSFGIYGQRFVSTDVISDIAYNPATYGIEGRDGVEFRINSNLEASQRFPAVSMDDTGDLVAVWETNTGVTRQIFFNQSASPVDDAGGTVTEVRYDHTGGSIVVDDDEVLPGPVAQLVVTLGEEISTENGKTGPISIENPDNWMLTRAGIEMPNSIAQVTFSLNPATGKYEAIVTFDAEPQNAGYQPLENGRYELTLYSNVLDIFGNELDGDLNGYADDPGFTRSFIISGGSNQDIPVPPLPGVVNGRTFAETPGAVAVDGDGDHIVVWTAYDTALGLDRVYAAMYDADGNLATLPGGANPVFAVTDDPSFLADEQRYASVACDADGDFVVTWTNYRDGDADIYARRFNSAGEALGPAFRLNTYTDDIQQWSNVAMDVNGDFIVTWSSYGQEDGGIGDGFGVFARRFDAYGYPLAPEFQVNTTTAGDQQFASAAMSGEGQFVIVWQSDQNGIGDDIISRMFNADGSPTQGPYAGEILVNSDNGVGVEGNQRYPDVAMSLDGTLYSVTWSSSHHADTGAADQDGYAVFTKTFGAYEPDALYSYQYEGISVVFPDNQEFDNYQWNTPSDPNEPYAVPVANGLFYVPIDVTDLFLVDDLNVTIDIVHSDPSDLRIWLENPNGDRVILVEQNHQDLDDVGSDPTGENGRNFTGTQFDDDAATSIDDGTALPPYTGVYQPIGSLADFNSTLATGEWRLYVQDNDPAGDPDTEVDGGTLRSVTLDFTPQIALSTITQVNETAISNQIYPSIAMGYNTNAIITWSGYGDQLDHEDQTEYGVFRREFFFGQPTSGEERVNNVTEGAQWLSSVGVDADGNYVIAWTGEGAVFGSETDVYTYVSARESVVNDLAAPLVTGVYASDRTPILEGGVLNTNGVKQLIVTFNERLSTAVVSVNGVLVPAVQSVANPQNWVLDRNGAEVPGAVTDVDFHYNPQTRKYEAIVTIDGNGVSAGDVGLLPGDYSLTVRDLMEDTSGNDLDGDFDSVPGTEGTVTGHRGYRIAFSVSSKENVYGPEMRINDAANVWYEQRFIQAGGTGDGVEQSTRAVAVDHDGDYVVVWTSYGQDDPSDPYGAGVYMRMFDRNDNPLTGEVLVNCDASGDQRNASVAMDADGDFMIVWEGLGENGTWDIFGRRFNSVGAPTTPEFLINTHTNGAQINPAVAMDDFGNAVVVWGTAAQENSFFNDLRGQAYNYKGEKVGSEFQVNDLESGNPGSPSVPGDSEINPEVAMDDDGNFVVVWDHVDVQTNGVISGTSIIGRRFTLGATVGVTPTSGEFTVQANSQGIVNGRLHAARNAQIAMDHQGNFIVTWEEYVGDGYDVFFQSYNADGSTLGGVQQANMLVGADFVGQQVNPSVAMDADGDFAIVWNGQGGEPDPIYPNNEDLVGDVDDRGVFVREYSAGFGDTGTVPQAIAPQERVNHTDAGIQEHPTIAMEPDGDYIVVWSGQGVGDHHGIFARRYNEVEDNAGPIVTDFTDAAGISLGNGIQVIAEMNYLVVTFDEEMYVGSGENDPESVLNPANWIFTKDGQPLIGGIDSIQFGLNQSQVMGLRADETNKWEAVIRVDGNGLTDGLIPLGEGEYQITARNTLRDAAGNRLMSDGYNYLGASSSRTFSVLLAAGPERLENSNHTAGPQFIVDPTTVTESGPNSPVAVAGDADGDYVTVWTDADPGHEGLYAHLTYVDWTNPIDEPDSDRESSYSKLNPGPVDDIFLTITTNPTATSPSVARDADGDFVVTWAQLDDTDGNGTAEDWNIYAQRFTAAGVPRDAQPFMVNATVADAQQAPAVALDHDGDFVITWQSNVQDGNGLGIYAQRFSAEGYRVGGQNAVQTLTFNNSSLTSFTLSLDGKTTAAIDFTGNAYDFEQNNVNAIETALADAGIAAKVYVIDESTIRVEFQDEYGGQELDLLTPSSATIDVETTEDGIAGEFRVNDKIENNQADPAVAMDAEGRFIITWTSFGQDPNASDTLYDGNIYGKLFDDFDFNIDFTDPTDPTGLAGTEFLVNQNSLAVLVDVDGNPVLDADDNLIYVQLSDIQPGNQQWSAVAMDMNGDFVVTWTSYIDGDFGDSGHNDVYARRYDSSGAATSGAFRVNSSETGDQQRSQVSMDANGDFVITWEGSESLFGDGSCGSSTDVNFGIFAQRYVASGQTNSVNTGVNGELGGQILVNGTMTGNQRFPSVAVDDTGDIVVVWCGNGVGDTQGIFSRRFDKAVDDAGPTVADVIDTTTSADIRVYEGRVLDHDVETMIVTFSEEMFESFNPQELDTSITNVDNWDLMKNGALLQDIIQSVDFGWNETTKKFEAEIVFTEPLTNGFYNLIVYDSVTDMSENPLDGNYDGIPLADFDRFFRINTNEGGGDDPSQVIDVENGRTFPETPGAVAVDRDGDTFVAFTGSDTAGLDKAYVARYDAFGNELGLLLVTDGVGAFAGDEQRFVSVACDLDGDFVVTWTNYRDGEQDVYGRLFTATGQPKDDPFRINAFTENNQKWSNVDMDADGDFVVTWSSYGQELGGATGYGYGIYARRFDRTGHALAPEFQVNTTIAGNQQHSSVAVDAQGGFIVAWQSDQNGIGDDIVYRTFESDGSPSATPLTGEAIANVDSVLSADGETFVLEGIEGNQRYPDVDVTLDGDNFVITWASSGHNFPVTGANIPVDEDGWAIFAKTFARRTRDEEITIFEEPNVPIPIPHMGNYSLFAGLYPDNVILANGAVGIPITVTESFRIETLTLDLTVRHEDPSDMIMWLESPTGRTATLVQNRPSVGDDNGFTAAGPNGSNFTNTTFDDLAAVRIDDPDNAQPPFPDAYVPEDSLESSFQNEPAQGTWILWVQDFDPPGDPDEDSVIDDNGREFTYPRIDSGQFVSATLHFTASPATSLTMQVNETTMGHQVYPSVAVDGSGGAVFTWSGYGNQPGEEDEYQYGVYTRQMIDEVLIGGERRLNEVPEGQQWLSSVGSDADGNFVVAWTGEGRTTTSETSIYTYFSVLDADLGMEDDFVGPLVSGVYDEDGNFLVNGAAIASADLTTLVVAFDESMSTHTTGADKNPVVNSIENIENWILERGGSEIEGAVKDVQFGYNATTRRWEAIVTLDNNGLSPGESPLQVGEYVLTVRDLVTDAAGNQLDGDFDGSTGTEGSSTGYEGYPFRFSVAADDRVLGPEFRVNVNSEEDPTENEQRLTEPGGTGLAREQSNRSVAVDYDGDYAVVWTGYDADGTTSSVFYAVYNKSDDLINYGKANQLSGIHKNASIAMDADGDFVVVWQGLVPDGDGNPENDNWEIYAQRFDAVGNRIAANASEGRNTSDPVWGTSANAYREIQVNTEEANDQVNPAVATDEYGNFIVTWVTTGQAFSWFNDVKAQLFDYRGFFLGREFQVNSADLPGTGLSTGGAGGSEVNPSVAMDSYGHVVFTWEQVQQQLNGVVIDSDIVARRFLLGWNPDVPAWFMNEQFIAPLDLVEFVASDGDLAPDDASNQPEDPATGGSPGEQDIERVARNPQIAMDKYGNFTVVWESFRDNDFEAGDVESYGIYYNRFAWDGTPLPDSVQQANMVITLQDDDTIDNITAAEPVELAQVNPSIAIDADGDFSIVWNGNGAEPDALDPTNWQLMGNRDDAGVFIRSFHAASYATGVDLNGDGIPEFALDTNGDGILDDFAPDVVSSPVTQQRRVNYTTGGVQQYPTIAMEPDGDAIVVWSGNGVGDENGIFVRHYDEATDTAGPIVTELRTMTGALVYDYDTVFGDITKLKVVFSEQVRTGGGYNAVDNLNNWGMLNGEGEEIPGGVSGVTFGYDSVLGKWVAEVELNRAFIPDGEYTLFARSQVQDIAGNPMARTGFRPGGTGQEYGYDWNNGLWTDGFSPYTPVASLSGAMGFTFRIKNGSATTPVDGDTDERISALPLLPLPTANDDGTGTGTGTGGTTTGTDTVTVTEEYILSIIGDHQDVALARNDSGEYVAVWVRESLSQAWADVEYTQDTTGTGGTTGGTGDTTTSGQVAEVLPVHQTDIVARRFDQYGRPLGTEFVVNSWVGEAPFEIDQFEADNNQLEPDVAIADDGSFVVVWSGDGELTGDQSGIFGQKYDATGTKVGGNFRINVETYERQSEPSIGMNPSTGRFVVSWTSREQDGASDGVYHRVFNANCTPATGFATDVLVNTRTVGGQNSSDVSMDRFGNYVIVWQSDGQDGSQWGVYGQEYWAGGARKGSEFRVNSYTQGSQYDPQVAMNGKSWDVGYTVVWTSWGQDGSSDGIYGRVRFYNGAASGEFRINETTARQQFQPDVDMNDNGTFVVSWTGYDKGDEMTDDLGVYARFFDSNGSPLSGEFRLNAVTDGDQHASAVAIDNSGNLATAWAGPNWIETNWTEPDWYTDGTWWFDPTWVEPDYPNTELPSPSSFTGIYTRVFGLNTSVLTLQPEARESIVIPGTAGDDYFEFISGATANDCVIRVTTDGQTKTYAIPQGVTKVKLTGLGGNDTAVVTGTTANETFRLQPSTIGSSTYEGGPVEVEIFDTETVHTAGGGGTDHVVLSGSSFDDTVVARPSQLNAWRKNAAGTKVFNLQATGFASAEVIPSAGDDSLTLFDQAFLSQTFTFQDVLLYDRLHDSPVGLSIAGGMYTVNGFPYTSPAQVRMDGNTSSRDRGDLEGYAAVSKQIRRDFHLGSGVDAESAMRVGEPDDGVEFGGLDFRNTSETLSISVVGNGVVSAWIDFDGNGTFDADEQILDAVAVSTGTNEVSFDWADVAGAETVNNAVARVVFTDPASTDVGEIEDYTGLSVVNTAPSEIDTSIEGDLNGDGAVNTGDLDLVRANWGQTVPAGDKTLGDANGDGQVNTGDLDIVRANWGQTAPVAAASQAPVVAPMRAAEPSESDSPAEEKAVYGPRRKTAAAADVLFDGLEVTAGSESTIAELAWAYEIEQLRAKQSTKASSASEESADKFFTMLGEE